RTLLRTVKYWSAAEQNARLPELTGLFFINRAIWMSVSIALFVATLALFKPQRYRGGKAARAKASGEPAATSPPAPLARPVHDACRAGNGSCIRTRRVVASTHRAFQARHRWRVARHPVSHPGRRAARPHLLQRNRFGENLRHVDLSDDGSHDPGNRWSRPIPPH